MGYEFGYCGWDIEGVCIFGISVISDINTDRKESLRSHI